MSQEKTGLFPANYTIGTPMPEGPLFSLHLLVFTPEKEVRGGGSISQGLLPPSAVNTWLTGDYTYLTVMPNNSRILVVATGFPVKHQPSQPGHIGPVFDPNLHLRMVLESDWKSGIANFQFFDSDGNWRSVENAPVKMIAEGEAAAKGK
jgi:hypothetical protein